jgi:hypothetical protein
MIETEFSRLDFASIFRRIIKNLMYDKTKKNIEKQLKTHLQNIPF